MYRGFFAFLFVLPLLFAGCKKSSTLAKLEEKPSTPSPGVAVSAASVAASPVATPALPAIDRSAKVMVLCYHRFEDNPHDALAIAPAEFRAQMQQLKDAGIQVVTMKDFLAWRRGERSIPSKSAVITVDDGYVSGYSVAWPIFRGMADIKRVRLPVHNVHLHQLYQRWR